MHQIAPKKGPMIRHQVYFDTLGSMQEDSASWCAIFAGLSVLRLVDAYADTGSSIDPANWAQLHSVRAAIERVSEGDTVRGALTPVLEEVTNRRSIDETVCRSLMAYGRTLDYAAAWGLAIDVFSTVARLTRPEKNAKLAVEAHGHMGLDGELGILFRTGQPGNRRENIDRQSPGCRVVQSAPVRHERPANGLVDRLAVGHFLEHTRQRAPHGIALADSLD